MKKLFLALITFLTVGFSISSCEFPEIPSPKLAISQDFITHVTVVKFITDASAEASGSLVLSLDKTVVSISGPDADKVYNLEGKKTFVINGGILPLLLDPSADFSGDKEFKINVVLEPVGYLRSIIPVTFTKDKNDGSVVVAMLRKSALPNTISLAKNTTGAITTAGLTNPINLTASNVANDGVTTAITVPAKIKMKDASDTVLTGKLETEVISFSESGNNTAYFPGGSLYAENVDLGGGITDSGAFIPAGFASINMTVGGKKVKTFEGEKVAVKITLSKDNYNPETKKPYETEDNIGLYSYDTTVGQWKYESIAKVKRDTDNSLYVPFETSHLSYFAIAKFFNNASNFCANKKNTLTFNWTSNTNSINAGIRFENISTTGTWTQLILTTNSTINKGESFEFDNLPSTPIRVSVVDNSTGLIVFSKDFAQGEICSNPTVSLLVPDPQPEVTLSYSATCANGKSVLPAPGTLMYFKESGSSQGWREFYKVNEENKNSSSFTTTLITVGKTYDFYVVAGSEKSERKYLIDKPIFSIAVILPARICNSF